MAMAISFRFVSKGESLCIPPAWPSPPIPYRRGGDARVNHHSRVASSLNEIGRFEKGAQGDKQAGSARSSAFGDTVTAKTDRGFSKNGIAELRLIFFISCVNN